MAGGGTGTMNLLGRATETSWTAKLHPLEYGIMLVYIQYQHQYDLFRSPGIGD